MKFETRRKKQLDIAKEWLKRVRTKLQEREPHEWTPEFSLLIAMEHVVKYLEMKE